jgi:hypothetical protein
MKIQNIVSRKTYIKDGQEKATWPICGTLRTNDAGKSFIELNMFPGQTFYVFDQKPRNEAPAGNTPEDIKWED